MKLQHKLKTFTLLIAMISICAGQITAQDINDSDEVIRLQNPSFEDIPRQGGSKFHIPIRGWIDCGSHTFDGQTPPDIHPTGSYAWSVDSRPQHGQTFLGMVVRFDDTHEFVGQKLEKPLLNGKCYSFSLYLSMSEQYVSPTSVNLDSMVNFTTPAVLRIWGGNTLCEDRAQLLAESEPITNLNWKPYFFKFQPKFNYKYIIIEAYYKTPLHFPYNGHILVDNCSDITAIECDKPMAEIIEEMDRQEVDRVEPDIAINTSPTQNQTAQTTTPTKPEPAVVAALPQPDKPKEIFKSRFLPELDSDKMNAGHTIRIRDLYFTADSSRIKTESFVILDELASFLRVNPNIRIEIGGHTAAFITPSYAKRLSNSRAEAVLEYLVEQGVAEDQLEAKGYGVEKPIVKNDEHSRRLQQKNQRVEIKVLSNS